MLEAMKAEFEQWHGYSVTEDMDIQTEVAWENWQAAWNAGANRKEIDCANKCERRADSVLNGALARQCAKDIRNGRRIDKARQTE